MGTGNLDLKNTSAYMVHHVLQRSKTISKKEKKNSKKKNKQAFTSILGIDQSKTNSKSSNSQPAKTAKDDNRNKKKLQNVEVLRKTNSNNTTILSTCKPYSNIRQDKPITPVFKSLFETHFENKTLFQWMINPINCDEFMKNYWEKKPLYISKSHDEFSLLLSTPLIDSVLTSGNVQYTKNIDITLYQHGVKELHNIEGTARPHVVWDYYCDGCSVRLLNPQAFVPNILKLSSELQEYFGCFVGCNSYLTPPGSQGFAPHYDDIEAFILQIEGKKRWRVYKPRSQTEILPRFSSVDFTDKDLPEPTMEVLLNAGDVLYLPRGYIHQAITEEEFHSLHITISMYQCNAWIDLLEKVIPKAMENAWKKDIEFRKGLPLDYLLAAGLSKDKKHKRTRILLESNLKILINKLPDYIQLDSSVDQMARGLIEDALPPVLTEDEKRCSVYGGGLRMEKQGYVAGAKEFEFSEDIEITLLRKYVSRLVKEMVEVPGSKKERVQYRLYYTTDNSLEYHAVQPSFAIIEKDGVPCIQYLFQSYPRYVTIKALPHENIECKITLVSELWERGVIRTKVPIMKE